jgi:hypothetical protein
LVSGLAPSAQLFDRYRTVELGVSCEVDDSHATAAELVEQLVATEMSTADIDTEHLARQAVSLDLPRERVGVEPREGSGHGRSLESRHPRYVDVRCVDGLSRRKCLALLWVSHAANLREKGTRGSVDLVSDEPRPHFGVERYIATLYRRLGRYFERSSVPGGIHSGPARGDQALVVGIYGPWGCGKTTWLRQLHARVTRDNCRPRHGSEDEPVSLTVPILFNAWQFEREPHLIVPLLKTAEVELRRTVDIARELSEADDGDDDTPNKTRVRSFLSWSRRRVGMLRDAMLATASGLNLNANISLPGDLANAKLEFDFGKTQRVYKDKQDGRREPSRQPTVLDAYESIYYELRAYMAHLTGRSARVPDALRWLEHAAEQIESRLLEHKDSELDEHELEILSWWGRRNAHQGASDELHGESDANADDFRLNLLFMIDDLDRCLPEKAVEMLESIKLFLEVPGCAFVLAVDDEVVERGIRHRYKDYLLGDGAAPGRAPVTGAEYLEKLIHLPVRVPPVNSVEAKAFLLSEYRSLFQDAEDPVVALFVRCVPAVPRKLIRTAEVFGLLDEIARDQVGQNKFGAERYDRLLLARLVLLQLFAPALYRLGARPQGRSFLQDLKQLKAPRIADEIRELKTRLASDEPAVEVKRGRGANRESEATSGAGQRKLDEQRLQVALEVQLVLEQRSGFDPCAVVENEDYDWVSRVAAHYCVVPQYEGSELPAGESGPGPVAEPGKKSGSGQPLDLDAFVDLILDNDPATWRRALAEEREQIENRTFNATTVERILERAKLQQRSSLVWLAWIEVFAGTFRPVDLARLCRNVGLLREARDPALVLSRLCRIVNPPLLANPWLAVAQWRFGEANALFLQSYLEDEERKTLLAEADFRDCYLVGLDGRGVTLPLEASAWAWADLRHAELEPEIDTSLALREVGQLRALDLPIARGGGIHSVSLESGVVVSSHEDGTLQVWSPAGPLEQTLWIGERASGMTSWGDGLATIQRERGLARRTLQGDERWVVEGLDIGLDSRPCELADGRVAVGSADGMVRLFSPEIDRAVEEIPTGQRPVSALCSLGDDLAWGRVDGSIGVLPLSGGERCYMRDEEGAVIHHLQSLDAQRFVSANHEGVLRVWSRGGAELERRENRAKITSIVPLPDGFATGDEAARIRLWRDASVEELAKVPQCVWHLSAVDERRLRAVSEYRLQVWTTAGELRREVRDMTMIRAAAINDEIVAWSDLFSLSDEHHVWVLRTDESGVTQIRSTADLHVAQQIRVSGATIFARDDFGHDLTSWSGERFAAASRLRLSWGLGKVTDFAPLRAGLALVTEKRGLVIRRSRGEDTDDFETDHDKDDDLASPTDTPIDAIAVSPENERIAVAYRGAVIEVIGLSQRIDLQPEVERVRCLCWLDDERLVVGHAAGLTYQPLEGTKVSHDIPEVRCLARGRSHELLAGCVDGSVFLWVSLNDEPRQFHAHSHQLLAVHEREDGSLVTVAQDGVRFWNSDGSLREQLNVLSKSVVMWVRPNDEWPIVLESLHEHWSFSGGSHAADPNDWVSAFVTDASQADQANAPLFRVPLAVVDSNARSWGTDGDRGGSRHLRLRWPEDPKYRSALQRALLGPSQGPCRK